MSYDDLINQMIEEAIARGDFDNLPGAGKPLDHSRYFAAPEELRLAHDMLRSAGYIPEEVNLLKEIAGLKEALTTAADETERERLRAEINATRLRLDLLMEPKRRRR